MTIDDEEDDLFYDSGPFCRHWSHPADCEVKCARCGHPCGDHCSDLCEAFEAECPCPEWVEPED